MLLTLRVVCMKGAIFCNRKLLRDRGLSGICYRRDFAFCLVIKPVGLLNADKNGEVMLF